MQRVEVRFVVEMEWQRDTARRILEDGLEDDEHVEIGLFSPVISCAGPDSFKWSFTEK